MKLNLVESCNITVLVDSVSDILSTVPLFVTNEVQNVLGRKKVLSGRNLCCAHWGLSLVLTAKFKGKTHSILFDTGSDTHTLKRNASRLGVDFGMIEALVFSHGHWDHVGGATSALQLISKINKRKTPVYVNDGMFVKRGIKTSDGNIIPFAKVPSKKQLEKAGGNPTSNANEQYLFGGMFYLSGEIPRITNFEKGFPGHFKKEADKWVTDPLITDERFMAINLKNKGVIIFTSCSHAGVVNTLYEAHKVFNSLPLYGVIGGFHLSGLEPEKVISRTVKALKKFNLKLIIPGHCTGWRAIQALTETFGQKVVIPSAVGRRYRLEN